MVIARVRDTFFGVWVKKKIRIINDFRIFYIQIIVLEIFITWYFSLKKDYTKQNSCYFSYSKITHFAVLLHKLFIQRNESKQSSFLHSIKVLLKRKLYYPMQIAKNSDETF